MSHDRPPRNRQFWANPLRTAFLIWIGVSLTISAMGPFGSFPTLSFAERLVYWGTVVAAAIILIAILRAMVIQIFGKTLRPFQLDAILVPLFTVLYTPPLEYFTATAARELHPFGLVQMGLIVIGVSLMLIALREALQLHAPGAKLDEDQPAEEIADQPVDIKPQPQLFERVPEDLQGNLLAISGSDHYVEVRTCKGTASVLLRFSDALREIKDVPGQRVHRSHWVSYAAVSHVRRDGHRHFAVLRTGCEIPISRTYAKHASERWGTANETAISQ